MAVMSLSLSVKFVGGLGKESTVGRRACAEGYRARLGLRSVFSVHRKVRGSRWGRSQMSSDSILVGGVVVGFDRLVSPGDSMNTAEIRGRQQ